MSKKTKQRDYIAEAKHWDERVQQLTDERREAVIQRAQVLADGLSDTETSTSFGAALNVASSRIFAMVNQGKTKD